MRVWLFAYLIWCVSTQLSYCLTGKSFHSKALAWTTRACLDKSKPNVGAPRLVFRIHSIYRAMSCIPEWHVVLSNDLTVGSLRLTNNYPVVKPLGLWLVHSVWTVWTGPVCPFVHGWPSCQYVVLLRFVPSVRTIVMQLFLSIPLSHMVSTWLILPVVICLSQRLSHACLSTDRFTRWNREWLIKSVMVHWILPFLRANTCQPVAPTYSRMEERFY